MRTPQTTHSNPEWCQKTSEGIEISVRVQPKASKAKVVGPLGEQLKVAVHSAPEAGAANKELLVLLAKQLKVSKSKLSLISGDKSRSKKILITDRNLTPSETVKRLL